MQQGGVLFLHGVEVISEQREFVVKVIGLRHIHRLFLGGLGRLSFVFGTLEPFFQQNLLHDFGFFLRHDILGEFLLF